MNMILLNFALLIGGGSMPPVFDQSGNTGPMPPSYNTRSGQWEGQRQAPTPSPVSVPVAPAYQVVTVPVVPQGSFIRR